MTARPAAAPKNRWLIALGGVAIHICIGAVYAFSVYKNPLVKQMGWSMTEVAVTFSIAILILGAASAIMGRFVEHRGPRTSGLIAAVLWGLGVALSSISITTHSLYLFYLTYGVIGGIGLGIGYIAPVSTLVKWFPDRRGMATGLAIMGFGFGALISGPAEAYLINTVGLSTTFIVLGVAYLIVMSAGASYLAPPPAGWLPEGMKDRAAEKRVQPKVDPVQLTAVEAVQTRRFWLLWLMLFLNVSAGIMILESASPMLQQIVHMTPIAAASVVGFIGLFNGLGRIFWASLSDYIGRANTYTIFFLIGITTFIFLPRTPVAALFVALLFGLITVYGGGFASVPAYIADLFGTKELGAIHGYMLTAWSLAGVFGPLVNNVIRDTTKSYTGSFYVFTVLLLVALAASLVIRKDIRAMHAAPQASLAPAASSAQ